MRRTPYEKSFFNTLLVGEEPYVPYDRPPLSKEFLRGEKPRDALYFDPEQYFQDRGIDLIRGVAVQQLDLANKTAILTNGEGIAFEKALIATGGRPVRLKLPGGDLPGVYYLRTLDDSAAIAAEANPGKRAVLMGAGFIGMEVAASLTQRGVHVTVIEAQSHIWPRFANAILAGFFQDYCVKKGVTFHTNDLVTEIRGQGRPSAVVPRAGKELPCDFVCIAVGIVPNVELAQQAGLKVDNGIVVNEYLQSSHPDLYAAVKTRAPFVFVLAGSSGSGVTELKQIMESRPHGPDVDVVSRVFYEHEVESLGIGDRVLVVLSQLRQAGDELGREIRAVDKLGLYYVALNRRFANARRLRELAVRAVERVAVGDDRVKYDNCFDPGDVENKRFWLSALGVADALGNRFVVVEE